MMILAQESNKSGWNLTPFTTLATNQPSLKTKLDEFGGWNNDFAQNDGVPSELLRMAKKLKNYWKVSSKVTTDAKRQLLALNNLVQPFKDNNLPNDDDGGKDKSFK